MSSYFKQKQNYFSNSNTKKNKKKRKTNKQTTDASYKS